MASAHRLWMLLLVVTVQSTQSATTSGPMTMTTTTTATAPDPNTTATPGPTTTTLPTITNIIALAPPTTPPSAPILNSQNTSSLTLRWTATAAVSYMVQHAVVGGVLSDSLTSRTTVLSATINGLTPGQSYDVVVIAYSGVSDVNGTAGPSAAFTTKPSPPTGLKAAQSTRTITLDWGYATTGDVVHGFSLQCTPSIGGCSNSTWTSVGNGTIRTCTLSNASYGQQYSFSLRAESGAGISRDVFSAVDIVSIEIAAGQPTNLQVVERSRTEVDASWDVPVDAVVAGYRLYWNSTNSGTDGHKDTTTLNTTVDVLDPGYSYEFSVASTTASGSSSSPSSPVTYTAYPSEVTGLDLQTRTSSSLTFTWNFDDTNSRYDDYDYIFSPNMYAISGAPTNSGDMYTLIYSNLTADSEYTFRVRTRVTDSANAGPKKYSLFSNITDTTDEDSPTPVRNLAIKGTTDSSISISWESPEQENGVVIGYVLHVIPVNDTNSSCIQSVFFNCTDCQRKNYDYETAVMDLTSQCDPKRTSVQYTSNSSLYYTFDNLTVFTRYEITVFAINTKPPSNASKSAKTGEQSPKGIPDVTVGDIDHESISISWTKVSDDEGVIQGYYVSAVVASSGELDVSAMVPPSDLLEYTFKPLTPYTEYKIFVLAYNSAGNGTSRDGIRNTTSQYKPETPEDLSVKPSARSLKVSWKVPNIQNGVIQSYNIRVTNSTTTVYDRNTSDTTVNITDGIKPYTNYTVLVRAKTVYPEWGDAASSGLIRALQFNPDGEPNKFKAVNKTSSSVMLSWEEIDEELRNGVIQGYTLMYKTSTGSVNVELQKEQRSHNVTGLDPYTLYIFTLTGYVKIGVKMLHGPPANVSAKTKQAAPERITIENTVRDEWVNDDDIKPTEITFTLTDDVSQIFSKEQGEITHYQILVLASQSNDGVAAPQPPISWGKAEQQKDNPQPYAIEVKQNAPDSWRSARKKRAVERTVPVGREKCEVGSTKYCNGPLEPSTEYCIYMRGWTVGGYTDSDCVVQKKTKFDITTPIIIAVVVVVAVIIILVGVLYVLKKKGIILSDKGEKLASGGETPSPVPDEMPLRSMTPPPQAVHQRDFIAHADDMHRDQDFKFSQEYQKVRDMSAKHSHNAAVLGSNTSKNRWVDILPFDHSRVKLLPADEEEGSDYINANYMPGYSSRREYIATQGPLPGTIDHFWRMVWEQNVSMVVMLTQLVERGRRKCEQYWPENMEEAATYGDLVVTKRSESILPEYTIRIFDIQMGEVTRSVKQFFVSFWPDFGCPDNTSSLLNLVRVVRSHMRPESRGPLVIHCSAGVGRTGTYVAVDRLLQHIQDHDDIDIFNLVLEMRTYRCRMVQTEDQYIYIHDCLKEALLSSMSRRYTPDPALRRSATPEDPIYENTPTAVGADMVAVKVDADGDGDGDASGSVKNTEL